MAVLLQAIQRRGRVGDPTVTGGRYYFIRLPFFHEYLWFLCGCQTLIVLAYSYYTCALFKQLLFSSHFTHGVGCVDVMLLCSAMHVILSSINVSDSRALPLAYFCSLRHSVRLDCFVAYIHTVDYIPLVASIFSGFYVFFP